MTSLLEKFRVGDKVTVPKSPVARCGQMLHR